MIELLTTRHNPLVDPSLHVWGWQIAVYLFLGGWVAGCMVLTGHFLRQGRRPGQSSVSHVLPWVGLVLISLGMLALFLDLEHRLYVWRMYLTLQPTSPMSWGGWILLLVYPVLALAGLAGLPASFVSAWPRADGSPPACARVLGRSGSARPASWPAWRSASTPASS